MSDFDFPPPPPDASAPTPPQALVSPVIPDVDGLRERIARALFEHEYMQVRWTWEQEGKSESLRNYWLEGADAVLAEIGDVERQCKCETLHGSFTMRDGTTADTYVDRENCPIHRGDIERELAQLREAARVAVGAYFASGTLSQVAYAITADAMAALRDVLSLSGQPDER